uniref:hypothetical protein n=1 Tax=Methylocella sp. TaxID=1978226 RepID=UPI003783E0C9
AGLCAGAGRRGLAVVGVAAGRVAQRLVKWAEDATPRLHEARLAVAVSGAGPGEPELRRLLAEAGFTVVASARAGERERRTYRYDLIMPARARVEATPEAVERLARVHGVERLEWRRGGLAPDA